MRLPIVALLLGLAFLAGLRTQAILAPAQAAAAASPQVYHIAPTDTYPKLAQEIWGKSLRSFPFRRHRGRRLTKAPNHLHMTIDELVYVISGHGMGTIGSKKMLLGPGDIAFLPRGVPHLLVSAEKGRFDFSASPIQKKMAT